VFCMWIGWTATIFVLSGTEVYVFNVWSGHPCCVVKGIDILKLKKLSLHNYHLFGC
jgi:hypothetical protein